jgi:hypothetical protein
MPGTFPARDSRTTRHGLHVTTAGTLGHRVAESWATRPSPCTQMASHRLAVLAGVVETTDVEMSHD